MILINRKGFCCPRCYSHIKLGTPAVRTPHIPASMKSKRQRLTRLQSVDIDPSESKRKNLSDIDLFLHHFECTQQSEMIFCFLMPCQYLSPFIMRTRTHQNAHIHTNVHAQIHTYMITHTTSNTSHDIVLRGQNSPYGSTKAAT